MTEALGAHSPLGASGMKRWEACPYSVFAALGMKEDDESEFAAEGTAAHALIEAALLSDHAAWQFMGQDMKGFKVTPDMAKAADEWLALIRTAHPDRHQDNAWIERKFHCPSIHRLFYGTSDFVFYDEAARTVHVWDYKHGQGVVVEAKGNPQGLYYAAGVMETLDIWNKVDTVVIHIVQPRAAHWLGPHRTWEVTADFLDEWIAGTLIPAMDRAEAAMTPVETENGVFHYDVPDPVPGEHCQFCPVRHKKCHALIGMMQQAEVFLMRFETAGIEGFTPEERSRMWDLFDRLRVMNTANNKELTNLFAAGKRVPGLKQVTGKADRVWPKDVKVGEDVVPFEALAKREFGDAAFTVPELKSPAQFEKMPKGKTFTERHAFKPPGRLNIVRDTDSRPEVSRDTKSLFKPVPKKGN